MVCEILGLLSQVMHQKYGTTSLQDSEWSMTCICAYVKRLILIWRGNRGGEREQRTELHCQSGGSVRTGLVMCYVRKLGSGMSLSKVIRMSPKRGLKQGAGLV